MLPRVAPFHAIPIRPPVYSCARKLAEIIRPWTAGTSGSLDGGGAGLAARVPGPAQFLDVRKISPGPDNRPCLESASPGQAEPALVLVSVGFRLRGCGILHCRFAGRRTSRSVSTSGGTPDEPFSPAAAEAEAASDQRPSRNSYLPCVRPFRNSVRIESSLISRSSSVAARPSISCTVEPGWSRKACSTKRGAKPLGARLLPPPRRFAAAPGLPRLAPAGDARSPPAPRISSNSFLASDRPRA